MTKQRPARFPLVVFDWDGTLMDSLGSMVACATEAFREIDLVPPAPERIRGAIGLGLGEVAAHILPDADRAVRARLIAAYRQLWLGRYRHHVALYEGAAEALALLKDRGHRLAIATGRSRTGLTHDLAATGLTTAFATTRTADDAPSKPDPAMLLAVLEELEMSARAALMVGDTTYDLEMASRAGVEAVGVLTGSHSRRALDGFKPRACLETVADLPAYLESAQAPAP